MTTKEKKHVISVMHMMISEMGSNRATLKKIETKIDQHERELNQFAVWLSKELEAEK